MLRPISFEISHKASHDILARGLQRAVPVIADQMRQKLALEDQIEDHCFLHGWMDGWRFSSHLSNRDAYLPPTSGQPPLRSTNYKRAAATTIYHLQAPPRGGQPPLLSTTYKRITATTTFYHLQAGNRYYYLPPTSGQPLLLYLPPTSG